MSFFKLVISIHRDLHRNLFALACTKISCFIQCTSPPKLPCNLKERPNAWVRAQKKFNKNKVCGQALSLLKFFWARTRSLALAHCTSVRTYVVSERNDPKMTMNKKGQRRHIFYYYPNPKFRPFRSTVNEFQDICNLSLSH